MLTSQILCVATSWLLINGACTPGPGDPGRCCVSPSGFAAMLSFSICCHLSDSKSQLSRTLSNRCTFGA